MNEEQAIAKYGKKNLAEMRKSKYLECITVTLIDGKPDVPERDYELAYRDMILKNKIRLEERNPCL